MIFFFSSRRRHTRYIGDWSSDVCSSDLWKVVALESDGRRATAAELEAMKDGGWAFKGTEVSFEDPRVPPVKSSFKVDPRDRKSTRLNSSHRCISYAVFCLKKKKKKKQDT